jgi:hypothetical protein
MSRRHGAAHGSVNSRRAVCVGTSCLGECSDTTLQGTRHGSANAGSYWVRVIASVNTHTTRVTTHNSAMLAPSHPIPQCTVGLSALLSTVEVYDPASRSDQVRTAGRKG